ncbi:MAG: hypothetical protein WA739_21275 [Candidatus Acidiferrales bacterium]
MRLAKEQFTTIADMDEAVWVAQAVQPPATSTIDIHTLMTNELLIFGDWHTDGHGSDSPFNQAEKLLSAKRGAICEKVG